MHTMINCTQNEKPFTFLEQNDIGDYKVYVILPLLVQNNILSRDDTNKILIRCAYILSLYKNNYLSYDMTNNTLDTHQQVTANCDLLLHKLTSLVLLT